MDLDWTVKMVDLKSLRHMLVCRIEILFRPSHSSMSQITDGVRKGYKTDSSCQNNDQCQHCYKMFSNMTYEHSCVDGLRRITVTLANLSHRIACRFLCRIQRVQHDLHLCAFLLRSAAPDSPQGTAKQQAWQFTKEKFMVFILKSFV